MPDLKFIQTSILEIAYEDEGQRDGRPVMLLHGWPDAPRGWNPVAQILHAEGFRTIAPYLVIALALGYQPRGIFKVPNFEQSRRFWYQWFLCIDGGVERFSRDPVGFARIQWNTWSPPGWFDEEEFAATSEGFSNPDWIAITLNAYRARWLNGELKDSHYDRLLQRLSEIECLGTPTLMIQGSSDYCDDPKESEGLEKFFTGRYERLALEGVGHFPHRESPNKVAEAIIGLVHETD